MKARASNDWLGVEWEADAAGHIVPQLYDSASLKGQAPVWLPQPGSQQAFLQSSFVPEVLYESNRGCGKTDCLLMDFAQDVGKGWGPDWVGVLFRNSFPDLRDVINKSNAWFPRMFPGASYNAADHFWTFADGEILYFSYFETEKNYWKYHGHAYPWIGWEELCNWAHDQFYKRMFSCSRTARVGIRPRVRATTNPYGIGHNWVKHRFRLPVLSGRTVGKLIVGSRDKDGNLEPPRMVVHGHMMENQILLKATPDYPDKIRQAASSPAELAAWMNGSWDIVAGGMFDDLWCKNRDKIVVQPFPIPDHWRIDRSLDWGQSKPSSVGFWAESDGSDYRDAAGKLRSSVKGDLFRVGEIYTWTGEPNVGTRQLASQLAKEIVEYELARGWRTRDHIRVRPGPADSSIFDDDNGNCVADDLEKRVRIAEVEHRGAYFDRADKGPGSRVQGWNILRERMAAVARPEGGVREKSGIFIFATCAQWLRTVPTLPRDAKKIDDVDTNAEDHVGDETRYRVRREMSEAQVVRLRARF